MGYMRGRAGTLGLVGCGNNFHQMTIATWQQQHKHPSPSIPSYKQNASGLYEKIVSSISSVDTFKNFLSFYLLPTNANEQHNRFFCTTVLFARTMYGMDF